MAGEEQVDPPTEETVTEASTLTPPAEVLDQHLAKLAAGASQIALAAADGPADPLPPISIYQAVYELNGEVPPKLPDDHARAVAPLSHALEQSRSIVNAAVLAGIVDFANETPDRLLRHVFVTVQRGINPHASPIIPLHVQLDRKQFNENFRKLLTALERKRNPPAEPEPPAADATAGE